MNKVLIICGPTATGKTSLGLSLAKKFNGQIISADSRQVYQGMDIGTGKDLPKGAKLRSDGSYLINQIPLWGYDLVTPNQDFSVAQFTQFTHQTISSIHRQHQLPIVVGGTGLYLKAITQSLDTLNYPANRVLRQSLNSLSVSQLQKKLKDLNSQKLSSMNNSDINNPRRLIRAIEVSLSTQTMNRSTDLPAQTAKLLAGFSFFWIGLTAPLKTLDQAIIKRVDQRLKQGSKQEVESLLKKNYSWDLPAMSAMGYRQWRPFFENKVTLSSVRLNWIKAEQQYLRRQLTWFKSQDKINWFDVSDHDHEIKLVNQLQAWYTKT